MNRQVLADKYGRFPEERMNPSLYFKNRETEAIEDARNAGKVVIVAGAVALDVFVTKGWATRTVLGGQFLGAFEHNRAKTPEGRAAQDQRSLESLTNGALMAGGSRILGAAFRGASILATEAKNILSTSYSYGEATVTTQVGKDAVEIGRGGIGSSGYLEMEINVKVGINGERVAHGEAVFNEIYKTVQANASTPINGIRGIWTYGDNLASFNKLIVEKVNTGQMTIEQAAKDTFTGKMASKSGFSNVSSIVGEKNADGTYKAVYNIIFSK